MSAQPLGPGPGDDVFPPLEAHPIVHDPAGSDSVLVPVEEFKRLRRAALHARFLAARERGETERMTVEEFIERTGLPEELKAELRAVPVTRTA